MPWSFVYFTVGRLVQLILLCLRRREANEVEILVLRHELDILRRQQPRARLDSKDRAWLALLSRVLPRARWSAFVVTPDTVVGWHRRMVRRHWTYPTTPKGRPPIAADVQALIVRLAEENSLGLSAPPGRTRPVRLSRLGQLDPPRTCHARHHARAAAIVDDLARLSSVPSRWHRGLRLLLGRHGVPRPAPRPLLHRSRLTPRLVARRHRASDGGVGHPTSRNMVAAMEQRGVVPLHVIRDRDAKFSRSFDDVWRSIGAQIVRTPVRTPAANAFAERWVGTVRRECFDHRLVVNRGHAERALKTYVNHYNGHRPHRGLQLRAPDDPRPTDIATATFEHLRRRDVLGGLIHEYDLVAA